MNKLVEKLSKGSHPVVLERSKTAEELRQQIEDGFVLIKFTSTKGGTELGSRLDTSATNLDNAEFENSKGHVHLVGNLSLNYEKVQLVADIDISTLKGEGHLVPVANEIESSEATEDMDLVH